MTEHATTPRTGQESVWDYPRPPRVEPSDELVEVRFGGQTIVSTRRCLRVLETSHAPTYYVPLADIADVLRPTWVRTFCEFKGTAAYFDVVVGDEVARTAAWTYPDPEAGYRQLQDHVAFYPARMDACLVDGEVARSQDGGFYGGWITDRIVGPFKGSPGTHGW